MLIKVTQKHIDEGLVGSCHNCPVAKAIAEILNIDSRNIVVDGERVSLFRIGELRPYESWILPYIAIKWIYDFDKKLQMSPFEFVLEGI